MQNVHGYSRDLARRLSGRGREALHLESGDGPGHRQEGRGVPSIAGKCVGEEKWFEMRGAKCAFVMLVILVSRLTKN